LAQGQTQIKDTIEITRKLSEEWNGRSKDIGQRLGEVMTTLDSLKGKLFLKTKDALPHTSAIIKVAEELKESSTTSEDGPGDDFLDALDQLEMEAEVLKAKIAKRDTVIT